MSSYDAASGSMSSSRRTSSFGTLLPIGGHFSLPPSPRKRERLTISRSIAGGGRRHGPNESIPEIPSGDPQRSARKHQLARGAGDAGGGKRRRDHARAGAAALLAARLRKGDSDRQASRE